MSACVCSIGTESGRNDITSVCLCINCSQRKASESAFIAETLQTEMELLELRIHKMGGGGESQLTHIKCG